MPTLLIYDSKIKNLNLKLTFSKHLFIFLETFKKNKINKIKIK